jgi:hypothetical protein
MLTHIDDCPSRKKSKDLNEDDKINKYVCYKCDIYLTNEKEFRMSNLICDYKHANLYKIVQNVEHDKATLTVYQKFKKFNF